MKANPTRRSFLRSSSAALLGAAGAGLTGSLRAADPVLAPGARTQLPALKLGLVTYNLARAWDVPTIIKNCTEARFEAVELRTTHAHGVEVSLSPEQRKEVRARFSDSPVVLASLGSAFEFHATDPAELRRNIEGTKEYAKLAADVGAKGVKVRPNGLETAKGIPAEKTTEQIGKALAEVGAAAAEHGIEIRVEVHGSGTSRLPVIKEIMERANHPNVFVCWNSNQTDLEDGGLEANFALVREKIHFVHLRDLFLEEYPFRRLFRLLRESGYSGYCCAEIPESADGLRVMKYFRGLFLAYQDLL